jgi:hypothetical protein
MTLPAGVLVYGTGVAYGVTDFFQLGTNLLRNFYQIWNAQAKLSILDFEPFALAATMGFETFSLRAISSLNPDVRVTSYQPGLTTATRLGDSMALLLGGNLLFTQTTLPAPLPERSGLFRGAQVGAELSMVYGAKKGIRALTPGISYDFTYRLLGMGVTHHWTWFSLGFHYYPTAEQEAIVPLVGFGGALSF